MAQSVTLKHYQIYIWLFTYFVYVVLHAARKPLTIVRNVLYVENCPSCGFPPFNLANSKILLGGLDYAFLLPYAIGMIFFGKIARGHKVVNVLALITFLSGLLTVCFGLGYFMQVHTYSYYFAVQFSCGFAMSAGWPCLIEVITNWLGKKQRGFILGVWNSHSHIGNVLGTLISGYYVQTNWGMSFATPGILTAIFGLLIWNFMFEKPQDVGFSGEGTESFMAKTDSQSNLIFKDIFEIPNLFCYAFCCFFVKMNAYILLYWLPNYLFVASAGILTPNEAGTMSTFYDFGSIFGCMASGWLLDNYGRGPFICFLKLLMCCPLIIFLRMIAVSNYFFTGAILFGIGFFVNGSFGLLVTAIAADLGSFHKLRKKSGAISMISSFIDGIGSLGAAFGPLLAGIVASLSWNYVFSLMLCTLILSLLSLVKPSLQSMRSEPVEFV